MKFIIYAIAIGTIPCSVYASHAIIQAQTTAKKTDPRIETLQKQAEKERAQMQAWFKNKTTTNKKP